MAPAAVRDTLDALIRARGDDYSSLSRMLGRNAAYIQQFIKRGSPRALDERDRGVLARYFGVAETVLGGPAERQSTMSADPEQNRRSPTAADDGLVAVPRLDVGASAGPGSLNGSEEPDGQIAFQAGWLRELRPSAVSGLSLIRVEGNSMVPTLGPGDDILVDRGDAAERLRDGIYVLRVGDELIVKRLAMAPQGRRFTVLSDNPDYPGWADCTLAEVTVVGRVLWAGRRL